jgi:hypothetical protein
MGLAGAGAAWPAGWHRPAGRRAKTLDILATW